VTLNKQKGNMYGFVTHTWNAVKGKCPHDCSYCYMKVFPQGKLHFDEKELKTNLGEGNFIFVGSSCDMWAKKIPLEWIVEILEHCRKHPKNTYLFQTKNPERFIPYQNKNLFPDKSIFGTTIESNHTKGLSKAPSVNYRAFCMKKVKGRKFVTIEPICDFDLKPFVKMIKSIKPNFVNIGADSKGHGLNEPSWDKVQELIKELEKFTEVRIKDNLNRLKK